MRPNTDASSDGIVIAGGGLAAQRCAEGLRRAGYEGPIRMLCAEPDRPYDRPPLSKGVLTGEHSVSELPYPRPRAGDQLLDRSVRDPDPVPRPGAAG